MYVLPTNQEVDNAVKDMLDRLGFYDMPTDSPLKRELSSRIAECLPGHVVKAVHRDFPMSGS